MTQAKTSKRALLTSALSLLLCCTMLIGTTWAWFTDSVTSAGNKIQSGTLQVDLLVKGGNTDYTDYTSVKDSKAPIFDYDLWEPGYTLVTNAKVVNNGTLALKYTLKFVSEDDIASQKLAEVIDVFYAPSEVDVNSRDDVANLNLLGTLKDVFTQGEAVVMNDNLEPKGKENCEDFATIVLKMKEEAGNEYQNQTISAFDIQLLATQWTYENDTFDNQYDVNATYPTVPLSFKIGDKDYAGSPEFINSVKDDIDEDTNVIPSTKVFTIEVYTSGDMVAVSKMMQDNVISKNVGNEDNRRTIKLMNDIDMSGVDFIPFSSMRVTFDGNNHKLSNFTSHGGNVGNSRGTLCSYGGDWIVKNLTIENADVAGSQTGVIFGLCAGAKVENCTLGGDIKVTWTKSDETFQGIGAFVGFTNEGLVSFENTTVADNTKITIVKGDMDSYNDDGRPYQGTNPFVGAAAGVKTADEIAEDIIVGKNVTINGEPYAVKMTVNGKDYNVSPAFKSSVTPNIDNSGKLMHKKYTVSINTTGDLMAYADLANNSGWNSGDPMLLATLEINDDLDFSGIEWKKIHNRTSMVVNGNNHTISNLSDCLFGTVGTTFVNDLTLENVTAQGAQVGAFAGSIDGFHVKNCTLAGNINISYTATSETWRGIGALVGWNAGSLDFTNVNIADNTVINLDATGIKDGHAYPSALTYDTYVGTGTYTGTINAGLNVTVNYTHD